MSPIISGLIGGAVATLIVWIAAKRQKPGRIDSAGWRTLRPNWLIHATFLGCAGLAALPAYILLSGGSTRADAEAQNFYALLLLLGFGLGALLTAWAGYGRTVRWKGDELRIRTIFGGERVHSFSDIMALKKSDASGVYKIRFGDGSNVSLSTYLHGVQGLIFPLNDEELECKALSSRAS